MREAHARGRGGWRARVWLGVALQAIGAHAQQAPAVARASVATPERVTQSERLAILSQERNEAMARLAKATKESDALEITRVRGDLAALDREITATSRAPVYEIKVSAPPPQVRVAKVSAGKPADESQQAESEESHASWDVFKNFGKGNN